MSDALRGIGFFLTGLAIIAAITLGGWQAGWWFKTQDTNREAQVYSQSYGFQTSHAEALSHQITDIARIDTQIAGTTDPQQLPMLQAQRAHEIEDGCALFNSLTHPMPAHAQWGAQNCTGGN